MENFKNCIVNDPNKALEVLEALDSNKCAFSYIEPAKDLELPLDAAQIWKNAGEKALFERYSEELNQLYSHLGVEAYGDDIQEQALNQIDKLKNEIQALKVQISLLKGYADINKIIEKFAAQVKALAVYQDVSDYLEYCRDYLTTYIDEENHD